MSLKSVETIMITLSDVLSSALLASADPLLRTQVPGSLERVVRWVHSSEVLEIAPLLRGGELLLSGGEVVLALPAGKQEDYIRSLAGRHIAALAIQTAGQAAPLSERLIAAANEYGLPLIDLRAVVPFVDVAEAVNRLVVNEQAAAHLLVDDASRRIARQITDKGPHLPTILEILTTTLEAEVLLVAPDGVVLGHAGSADMDEGSKAMTGIVVGGQLAAQLTLRSPSSDPFLVELAADRLSGILALALAQAFRPTPAQVADARLLESVIEGADPATMRHFWLQAGLQPGQSAVVAVFRTEGTGANFTAIERSLHLGPATVKAHSWDGERVVLLALPQQDARSAREALILAAREALAGSDTFAAFGPTVGDGVRAHDSYVEAREIIRLGMPAAGEVLDAMDFLAWRILDAVPNRAFLDSYVESSLGEVLEYDRKHGTSLLTTLLCWLDTGCNTTASAVDLNVERQTMHKRINKISALLGGDPRVSGRLLAIHIAAAAATGGPAPQPSRRTD